MTLQAGRETVDYRFIVEHVGLDADFYHAKGRDLALAPHVVATFEDRREMAEIFIQNATGWAFSSDEILSWYLLQTATTLADHLPKTALAKAKAEGESRVLLTVPIRFEPGVFHMTTEAGQVDLRGLRLMMTVTIKRRNG